MYKHVLYMLICMHPLWLGGSQNYAAEQSRQDGKLHCIFVTGTHCRGTLIPEVTIPLLIFCLYAWSRREALHNKNAIGGEE